MINHASLLETIFYDPGSGSFTRLKRQANMLPGSIAGSPDGKGYLRVQVFGKRCKAHHLAWFYMTGSWPSDQIDHINGDGMDNRWSNLRLADIRVNAKNRPKHAKTRTLIPGVKWRPDRGAWSVRIYQDGREIGLGTFKDLLEALCVRKSAEIRLGFHENHGRA